MQVLPATFQSVRCPNCGNHAERHYVLESKITRTQCPSCDYLMVTYTESGRVIEAYAPGISVCSLAAK